MTCFPSTMGFRYKTPYRYSFFIVVHCVLIITVYLLFYNWSQFMTVKPYHYFLMSEVIINTILIMRGETVRYFKFVAIFSTLTFIVLICSFLPSNICCTSPIYVWLTVLIGFIVFRCIYVWMLFYLDKKCRIEYDKSQIREQIMAERDEQPFDRPFTAPTITGGLSESNSVQAPATRVPPITPGDPTGQVAPDAGEKKATGYGWAV